MAHLITPPATRQNSEVPNLDPATDLVRSLDTLLERYLGLLDKHQKLQGELASKLSSGFLSLAHANYTSPPGRRYGADYYDERMKATRRIKSKPASFREQNSISGSRELPEIGAPTKLIFSIALARSSSTDEILVKQIEPPENDGKAGESIDSNEDGDSGAVNTTERSQSLLSRQEALAGAGTKPNPKKKLEILDPIKWYGILVPPSLRNAQNSFTEAVEDCFPELASVIVEMQATEKDVIRLRKELGRQ
ncbi:hypothetical protein BJX64DRAFT_249848 [Aspergillus heterothallicus]